MAFYFDENQNLRTGELDEWPWLVHGFGTRAAGDMAAPAARQHFAQVAGGPEMTLVTLRQLHSAIVHVAGGNDVAGIPGDGLITGRAGLLLGIKTADCLPILLVDGQRRVVAAVHAGWRGCTQRIVEKCVSEMRRCFGCDPSDLQAAVGPGIQQCCFEVGAEVLEQFFSQFPDAGRFCRRDPVSSVRGTVDLTEAVRRQLLAAGVRSEQIYRSALCTGCDLSRFYSYRREKEAAGRMLAVIGVRSCN